MQGPGGELLGDDRLRGVHRGGRPGVRVAAARRRMAGDLAQLHVGNDRQSQGRGLSLSRRLSQCAVQHHRLGHAAAFGLPVDAAAVPLQRLVLRVDDGRQRGHQRVPAQGRGPGDLRRDPRAQGHALLRRADRAFAAHQRARGDEARHHAQGVGAGRGRGAAGVGDRRHGAHGLRHHARVRPDRDLRPRRRVRQARRVGRRSTSARAPSATAARACATRRRKA